MTEPEPYRPYEHTPDEPPRLPVAGARIGRVEGAATRVEGQGGNVRGETVLAFRLLDAQTGTRTEVELRGSTIAGTVRDGDWVEIAGGPSRSGRLEPVRLQNLTTQSEVTVGGSQRGPAARVLAVLFILVFLAVAAFIVKGFLDMSTGGGF